MTWHPTKWRKPRTTRKLRVRFRNGDDSKHSYSADQLNWSDRGEPFDIVEIKFDDE